MKIFKKIISLILTAAIMVSIVCVGTVSAGAEEYKKTEYTVTGKYDDDLYEITLGGIGGQEYAEELLAYLKGESLVNEFLLATDDGVYMIMLTSSYSGGAKITFWLDKWDSTTKKSSGNFEQITNIYSSVMSDQIDETGNFAEIVIKISSDGNGETFINALKSCDNVFVLRGTYKNGALVAYNASPTEKNVKPNFKFGTASSSTSKKNISSLSISKISDYTYTGKARKPAVTVKDGTKTLKSGTDYTLTYKNNNKIGTASVTITGKGNYTGSKTVEFKIVPKKTTLKVTKKSDTKAKFSWTAVKGAEKYQIYYSTNGGKYKKLATVSGSKTSATLSGLDFKKNDYKFKIRSYDKADGKTYYSSFSKVVAVNKNNRHCESNACCFILSAAHIPSATFLSV